MSRFYTLSAALLLSLFAATAVHAAFKPVKLDPVHSKVGFTASTLLFDVDGHFAKYDIQVDGDPKNLSRARVKMEIDTASIDTDNAKRDKHLKSADFLDAKKYPKIRFTSSRIAVKGNRVEVTGKLNLHGHTKVVTIPFRKAQGKNGAGVPTTAFKGKLTIDRNDFGVGTDSIAAKISLEDEVEIELLLLAFL